MTWTACGRTAGRSIGKRKAEMERFTAYHAVTERPMHQGQVLTIGEGWQSGVCRRVLEKLPVVEEIYQNPAAWAGKELEHHTMVALRELALEQVRKESFPQCPSRLHCLYVTETLEEARWWGEFFAGLGRPAYHIVKLQVTGRRFEGNANLCFDATPCRQENLALARRYWQVETPVGEPPVRELLVDGEILVEKIVEEIGKNLEVDCR